MRRPSALLACGLALACLASCRSRPTATPEQYRYYCARCHGPQGEGDPKSLRRHPAADLRVSPMMERGDRTALRSRIATGYGPMPGFSKWLSPAEIERMIDFILQLRGNPRERK